MSLRERLIANKFVAVRLIAGVILGPPVPEQDAIICSPVREQASLGERLVTQFAWRLAFSRQQARSVTDRWTVWRENRRANGSDYRRARAMEDTGRASPGHTAENKALGQQTIFHRHDDALAPVLYLMTRNPNATAAVLGRTYSAPLENPFYQVPRRYLLALVHAMRTSPNADTQSVAVAFERLELLVDGRPTTGRAELDAVAGQTIDQVLGFAEFYDRPELPNLQAEHARANALPPEDSIMPGSELSRRGWECLGRVLADRPALREHILDMVRATQGRDIIRAATSAAWYIDRAYVPLPEGAVPGVGFEATRPQGLVTQPELGAFSRALAVVAATRSGELLNTTGTLT